jgi:DNA-binding IscR family transcriptional regulator
MTACAHGDHECGQFSKCIVRDPLHRIRDRIAAILTECSILEIVADPEPSASVRVMSLPAMRRVTAL